ncbi:hypothetical protein K1719_027691 [Acacia pycnantha]|nr:hypothetical protein K1719_027691 [Acacia pycnantha]
MVVAENVGAIIGSSGENLENRVVSSDSTVPNELEKSKLKPGSMGNGIETNVQTVNGDQNLNVVFNNNDIISTTISVPNNNYKAHMAHMRNEFEGNGV